VTSRRSPTQARSRRRYEAILDAAGHVFAEVGFEGATMEAIALRAGTSIGSLYQFFPNKRALFAALGESCVERSRARYREILGPDPLSRPWTELLDASIDGFAELMENDPAFRALWLNLHLHGEYAEADAILEREFVTTTAWILGAHASSVPEKKRTVIAKVVVQTISAILFLCARDGGEDARELLAETKTMLHSYIRTALGESARDKPTTRRSSSRGLAVVPRRR
jgi:AcrR family transcriptional regulator